MLLKSNNYFRLQERRGQMYSSLYIYIFNVINASLSFSVLIPEPGMFGSYEI